MQNQKFKALSIFCEHRVDTFRKVDNRKARTRIQQFNILGVTKRLMWWIQRTAQPQRKG